MCGSQLDLQVHHKHYARLYGEKMSDLQVMCSGCHQNHHEGLVYGVADPMTRAYWAALGGKVILPIPRKHRAPQM